MSVSIFSVFSGQRAKVCPFLTRVRVAKRGTTDSPDLHRLKYVSKSVLIRVICGKTHYSIFTIFPLCTAAPRRYMRHAYTPAGTCARGISVIKSCKSVAYISRPNKSYNTKCGMHVLAIYTNTEIVIICRYNSTDKIKPSAIKPPLSTDQTQASP